MSWSGRGIERDTRERVIEAARRSGMSVSELVKSLAASAEEDDASRRTTRSPEPTSRRMSEAVPRRDDLDRQLDVLSERMRQLTRSTEPRGRRDRPVDRAQQATLAEIAETVERLDRLSQAAPHPAEKPRVTERAADVGGILEALDGLDRRVRALTEDQAEHRADDEARRPVSNSERGGSAPRRRAPNATMERHFQDLTAKIDQLRARDEQTSTTRIVSEIRALRAIIEQRIGSEGEVSSEILRLTGKIDQIAVQHPERAVIEPLMTEIGRLRDVVLQNNVEGSLKTLEVGYGHIVDRLDELKRGIAGPRVEAKVDAEISEIHSLLRTVPQVAQISAIERSLSGLAEKIEHLDGRGEDRGRDDIEHRLAELKGQIEQIDPVPVVRALDQRMKVVTDKLDKIEKAARGPVSSDRLLALFDEMRTIAAGSRTADEIHNLELRLAELSDRIAEIDRRRSDTADSDLLHDRIAEIATKIDRLGQNGAENRTVEALEATIARLDQLMARQPDDRPNKAMEKRVSALIDRLDRPSPTAEVEALAREIAEMRKDLAATRSTTDLETQMRALAEKLERTAVQEPDDEALGQIEDHLTRISHQLETTEGRFQEIGLIEATIRRLGDKLENQHDDTIAAAREAAREMVREIGATRSDGASESVMRALQDDLRSLQSAARDTETRTTDTLISLHDALTGIVGRLTAIEKIAQSSARSAAAARASAPVRNVAESAVPTAPAAPVATPVAGPTIAGRPVQASPAADGSAAKRMRDLLGGSAEDTRPLEPGSGKPKVAPIPSVKSEPPLASPIQENPYVTPRDGVPASARKADFIAAARRAAQAAATATGPSPLVADAADRTTGPADAPTAGPSGALSRIGQALKNRRRPLVLATAAVVLAILALRIIPSSTPDVPQTAAIQQEPDRATQTASTPAIVAPAEKPRDAAATQPLGSQTTAPAVPASIAVPVPEPAPARTSELSAPTPDAALLSAQPTITGSIPSTEARQPATPAPEVALALPTQVGSERLRSAALKGDPRAAFEVGMRLAEGRGLPADPKLALDWYRRAADQGLVPAQYRLAVALEKGLGTPRDAEQAKRLYLLAAEKGNVRAMHNLGVLYANARDMASALPWFQKAADFGLKDSQFNLGIIHALGSGVTQDLAVSYKWFALAARQGDQEADKKVADVATHLDKVNLAAARMAVQTWVQKPIDRTANDELQVWSEPKDAAKVGPGAALDQPPIERAQSLLAARGIYSGPIDGAMSQKTRTAVRTFQKKIGQPQTGEVDAKLLQVLAGRDS